MTIPAHLHQTLTSIQTNAATLLRRAEDTFTDIILLDQRADAIAAQGMYNFQEPPLELWESRNGSDAKYLRLRFHETPAHCPYIDVPRPYDGPNGQRQTYIGADPARIAEARLRVLRRNEWLDLQSQIRLHQRTLNLIYRQLNL
jgi:hypothetical protein